MQLRTGCIYLNGFANNLFCLWNSIYVLRLNLWWCHTTLLIRGAHVAICSFSVLLPGHRTVFEYFVGLLCFKIAFTPRRLSNYVHLVCIYQRHRIDVPTHFENKRRMQTYEFVFIWYNSNESNRFSTTTIHIMCVVVCSLFILAFWFTCFKITHITFQ